MDEILTYLYGLQRLGIKLGLEVITRLLETFDNPHTKFKSIHIAGTNGKGSTAAFLASMLQCAGYTVGLYTSPHLIRFNERICVQGKAISDEKIVELTEVIREHAKNAKLEPTFFEFTTTMGFLYFTQQKVDIAIIEAGVGGEFDATNVITPLVSIITNIDMDHTQLLGENKLEIASTKAGIIKRNVPLITGERDPTIINLFQQRCARQQSKFWNVHEQLHPTIIMQNLEGQEFLVQGITHKTLWTQMVGNHQIDNACTALMAAHCLQQQGMDLPETAIINGIANARWRGRLEILSRKPLMMIDGAHNVAGMMRSCEFIRTLEKRKVLILAIAKDKNIPEMVRLVAPLFQQMIITQGNFKPAETTTIAQEARKYCNDVTEIPLVGKALDAARCMVAEDELLFITGSLYMVADVLEIIEKEEEVSAAAGRINLTATPTGRKY